MARAEPRRGVRSMGRRMVEVELSIGSGEYLCGEENGGKRNEGVGGLNLFTDAIARVRRTSHVMISSRPCARHTR